jgi:hypothetical protein
MFKLTQLRRDLDAHETVLVGHKAAMVEHYLRRKAHYRGKLASPTAMATSFIIGLFAGMMVLRPRRVQKPAEPQRRPWLNLARTLATPIVLGFLRERFTGLIEASKR